MLCAGFGLFSCGEEMPLESGPAENGKPAEEQPEEEPDPGKEDETPETPVSVPADTVASAEELSQLEIKPGDVIVWKDGTYDSEQLVIDASGTEENPVTLRAETRGGVCFTGGSTADIKGRYVVVDGFWWKDPEPSREKIVNFAETSSHCILQECAVTAFGREPDAERSCKWISLSGTENTVTHCRFEDKKDMGALCVVWFAGGMKPSHHILNNKFARPETILDEEGEPANEQEVIRVGDSTNSMQEGGCEVSGNYFEHCNGEMAEIVSNKSCGNVYKGNYFFECKGTLTMRHGNNCVVSGNYFVGNDIEDTGGIRIIGEGHVVENNRLETLSSVGYKAALCLVRGQENPELSGYFQVRGAVVRNNTFVNCNLAMHVNYGSSSMTLPVIETRIENNVAVAADKSGYVVRYEHSDPEAEIEWTDNKFYGKFKSNYFDLKSESVRPDILDADAEKQAIVELSGTSW